MSSTPGCGLFRLVAKDYANELVQMDQELGAELLQ